MKDKQKKTKHHGGARLNQVSSGKQAPQKTTAPSQEMGETMISAVAEPNKKETNAKANKRQRSVLADCKERLRTLGAKAVTFVEAWVAELPEESSAHTWVRVPRRVCQVWQAVRAKRFPDSNHKLVQLALLAWGAIPGMLSLGAMSMQQLHRRTHTLLQSANNPVRERKGWHTAAFLGGSGVLAAVAIFCSLYTIGTTVQFGDVSVAVKSPEEVEAVLEQVESVTAQTLGQAFTLDKTQVEYSAGQILPRSTLVEMDELVEELVEDVSSQVDIEEPAYALYVDGDFVGATPYEGALEEVLEQLKTSIVDEDTISCDFAEEIEIRKEVVDEEDIINLGYLAELLYSTKEGEVTYTVVSGDVWSKVAQNNGLTSNELLAMNPGYDINKLSIGEVLTISTAVPYLTVTVQQREHYVAEVPYEIEYTDSADMYKGDYKVTSAGSNGTADTVANVTYINGVEVERTILSSVNLQDPVTEQRLQGTMDRPTWMATGSFRWPTSGSITSYFGYRNAFSGASSYHQGIDIANGYGTAIYAADGGTVTYAGWMGGYGYLVEIDHGNGYTTRYGHNSSLLVSVGDKVYKGQQISRMGSTGVSSGNHCHFEIRYNGTAQNPLNYI